MNIVITTPSFSKHGGIRVIMEIANGLAEKHDVTLYSLWDTKGVEYWNLHPSIRVTEKFNLNKVDCLILTSPHAVHLTEKLPPEIKVFCHLQMLEHLFQVDNAGWDHSCHKFYKLPYPMFTISKWNYNYLIGTCDRKEEDTVYIGNGVNYTDFPINFSCKKNPKAVLVEGWEAYNPAKDISHIAHKVARRLKEDGYKIMVYGQVPLRTDSEIPDEYYFCPSLEKMNELYSEATILLKASRYDCRSCAPVEAMTKGTVTARAIVEGDDDLIHGVNSLKVKYNQSQLYKAAKELLTNEILRGKLKQNCLKHLQENTWEKWIGVIDERISR